jgi:hypothetical protein
LLCSLGKKAQEIMSPALRRPTDSIALSFALLLLLAGSISREDVSQDAAPAAAIAPAVLREESPPAAVAALPAAAEPQEPQAPAPRRGQRPPASHPQAARPAPTALAEARGDAASSGSTPATAVPLALAAVVSGAAPHARVEVMPLLPLPQDAFPQQLPPAFGDASLSPAVLSAAVSGVRAETVTLQGLNSITDRAFHAAIGAASITQVQDVNGAAVQNISIFATSR